MNANSTITMANRTNAVQLNTKSGTEESGSQKPSFWTPAMVVDWIAGLIGGATGVLVGHPLDTVKVHLQTDDPKNPRYRGTIHCFRTILQNDRLIGLYRGITSPMAGIGLVNAIVFGVYGNVQRVREDPNSLMTHCLAGSTAGFAQSFICAPMELAKTRMQLMKHIDKEIKFKGPFQCLRHILYTDGIRGAFKGLIATIARDIPGFAGYFVSYEYLIRLQDKPNAFSTLMAGGLAGQCSWLTCYPIDVVKTTLQADALGKNAKYNGFFDCANQCYRKDGIPFFFRGLTSTLIRAFPMNAVCFLVVSLILEYADTKKIDMVVHADKPISVSNKNDSSKIVVNIVNPSDAELVRKIISKNFNNESPNHSSICHSNSKND